MSSTANATLCLNFDTAAYLPQHNTVLCIGKCAGNIWWFCRRFKKKGGGGVTNVGISCGPTSLLAIYAMKYVYTIGDSKIKVTKVGVSVQQGINSFPA